MASWTYPEGATPLDPDECDGLRHKHITTRAALDELEQANIAEGLRWLSKLRRKDILSDDFVIDLHRRLFGKVWRWAGMFRRTNKNIGVDPNRIGTDLRMLMDDARYWAEHRPYTPVEAAIRLHHRLVFIHPFVNGNGRHARIMADTVLVRVYGSARIDWTAGVNLQEMNERRSAYIAALKAADAHDYGPLLAFANPVADQETS